MITSITTSDVASRGSDDASYDAFLACLRSEFDAVARSGRPLLTTNADPDALWQAYLGGFPDPVVRQHYNCHACRAFVRRVGGLAVVDPDGSLVSVFWGCVQAQLPGAAAMARLVRRASVTGVFLSSQDTLGTPVTGPWRHMAVTLPEACRVRDRLHTAHQLMAAKAEDYASVRRALREFDAEVVATAVRVLESDALYRAEKVIGPAQWLHTLHQTIDGTYGTYRDNLIWLAVATAPAGFCHPRTSMVGTLLEDIAARLGFNEVARRFAAKMHPLRYARPQAAPSAGAIDAAEKVVATLKASGSLARRFARMDEVQALWRPRADEMVAPAGGVFAHLKAREVGYHLINTPPQVMTWVKFAQEVLPGAEAIEILIPERGPFTTLATAVDFDAPPILQWDLPAARNPVSWYFWYGGSESPQFTLATNSWAPVDAIALQPSMWTGEFPQHGKGIFFGIQGARDTRTPTMCLFPEMLKSEFHPVRSVLEAYSQGAKMTTDVESPAAGLMYKTGSAWDVALRVRAGNMKSLYKLDRWD